MELVSNTKLQDQIPTVVIMNQVINDVPNVRFSSDGREFIVLVAGLSLEQDPRVPQEDINYC